LELFLTGLAWLEFNLSVRVLFLKHREELGSLSSFLVRLVALEDVVL